LAWARTFLWRALATTPLLTRGMSFSGSGVGHHGADTHRIRLVHLHGAPQLALVLGGLLGEDVALERLAALDRAARTNAEPLGRALLRLHLGHGSTLNLASRPIEVTRSRPSAPGEPGAGMRQPCVLVGPARRSKIGRA